MWVIVNCHWKSALINVNNICGAMVHFYNIMAYDLKEMFIITGSCHMEIKWGNSMGGSYFAVIFIII